MFLVTSMGHFAGEGLRTLARHAARFIGAGFPVQHFQRRVERFQCAFALDRTQDVLRDDVAGAFPDRTQVGITHQPGVGPLLDIAGATAHLHRVAGGFAGIAAGAELEQGREDADAASCSLITGIGGFECARCGEGHRACGFRHQQDFHQLAACQRHLDHALAECHAVARHVPRLEVGAAHQAGSAHAVGQARHVDHVGHLHETTRFFTDEVGHRAFEPDFPARHGACAHLVLQAHDAIVIPAAIGQGAGQQEQAQAARAAIWSVGWRGAPRAVLRPCQHQRQFGIGIRAEPFVTGEQPVVTGAGGDGGGCANVGTGTLFGHEHRALGVNVHILRSQARQIARHQFRAAEFA